MQRKKYLGHEEFFSLSENFKNIWVMKKIIVRCKQKETFFVMKKMLFYRHGKRKRDKVVTQIHNHQM
jgi:hypothetical protein